MPVVELEKCIKCGLCYHACPVGAISLNQEGKPLIDTLGCVECGVCIRICPVKTIKRVELPFPEMFKLLSDPALPKITGIPGRGTDEVKTNDVTGRIKRGEVGITIDVGRPNVGTTLEDIVKILKALEAAGVELEKENPQMIILKALEEGKLTSEDLRRIKLMSMVIEGKTLLRDLPKVVEALKAVEKEVNTVFSVGIICRFNDDMSIPCLELLELSGVKPMPFAKINLGLGRPLALD